MELKGPIYLDHDLFKFCFNLDNKFKIKKLKTRILMRNILKEKKNILKNTITDPQRNLLMTDLRAIQ